MSGEGSGRSDCVPERRQPATAGDPASRTPRVSRWAIAALALAALAIPAVAYWQWPTQPPAGSVAVIPFVSAEPTPDGRRFADGISEGVINALAQLPDLKVIARSSSFRYAGDSLDVPMVAKTLGVQTLVTGRIVDNNGQLTISAELVNGRDITAMWRGSYTPSTANAMDVEAQIAREIARRIRSELTPADQRRLDKTAASHAEVHSLLQRGRYEMSLYTPESAQKAMSRIPGSVGHRFHLSRWRTPSLPTRISVSPPPEVSHLPKPCDSASQAARKALAVDKELPEAHAALANILRDQWQWADAERAYRSAIDFSPSFGPARQALAIALTLAGKRDEAVAEITAHTRSIPSACPAAVESAAVFYNLRLYDRALATLNDRCASRQSCVRAVEMGRHRQRRKRGLHRRGGRLREGDFLGRLRSGHPLLLRARVGPGGAARRRATDLELARSNVAPSRHRFWRSRHLGLGNRERALEYLEMGFTARDPLLQDIVVESYLDAIMDDPACFSEDRRGHGPALPPRRSADHTCDERLA